MVYVSFWVPFTGKTTHCIWNKKMELTVSLSVSTNLFEDLREAKLKVVQLFDWLTRQKRAEFDLAVSFDQVFLKYITRRHCQDHRHYHIFCAVQNTFYLFIYLKNHSCMRMLTLVNFLPPLVELSWTSEWLTSDSMTPAKQNRCIWSKC